MVVRKLENVYNEQLYILYHTTMKIVDNIIGLISLFKDIFLMSSVVVTNN